MFSRPTIFTIYKWNLNFILNRKFLVRFKPLALVLNRYNQKLNFTLIFKNVNSESELRNSLQFLHSRKYKNYKTEIRNAGQKLSTCIPSTLVF
jgi:hypothetical protein